MRSAARGARSLALANLCASTSKQDTESKLILSKIATAIAGRCRKAPTDFRFCPLHL
jgi:hypothetical protein